MKPSSNPVPTPPAPHTQHAHLHRSVVRALATRPLLTSIVVVEYGLRYAAGSLLDTRRWALLLAAAIVCVCAVLMPGVPARIVGGPCVTFHGQGA